MNIRDRIKEFRRVKASELRPHPNNWRMHPQSQQDALRGVLAEVGYVDALMVRPLPDGSLQIVDGHLRAETTPDAEVPCLVVDLDDSEAAKVLATFDPLAAMAESNAANLDAILREVNTGSEALQEMLAELAKDAGLYKTGEVEEDEVPEPPVDPVTKPGDLWLLGEHRLLCGDSTKAEDVGRVLAGRKPFIMVTDPPYGVEYDPTWRDDAGGQFGDGKTVMRGKVQNDDRLDWTEAYKLFPGAAAYVWHASFFTIDVGVNIRDAGFQIRSSIIWRKPHFIMSRGHYHWQHEPCWYAVRKGATSKWCGDRTQSTLWEIKGLNPVGGNRSEEKVGHGTQKPVECMARPIRNHGGPDDDVYDPFLGSGTTIIAAEQLGRRCYGLELEPKYCDVICQRWAKLTGKVPTLEDGTKFPVQA